MHLIRVDFPAALSPTNPTTSPRYNSKLTSLTAVKPPNRFTRFLTESTGSISLADFHSADNKIARLVDQHRKYYDDADHDILPERLHVEHDKTVVITAIISAPIKVPLTLPSSP